MGLRAIFFDAIGIKYRYGFNLPEGREGFKSRLLFVRQASLAGFNLPEGREGFKRIILSLNS